MSEATFIVSMYSCKWLHLSRIAKCAQKYASLQYCIAPANISTLLSLILIFRDADMVSLAIVMDTVSPKPLLPFVRMLNHEHRIVCNHCE